jgi:hypothetical protein
VADLVADLEAEAERRFARWDRGLWRTVVEGPARGLAEALRSSRAAREEAEPVLAAYLRLACEGIGLGYLFPPAVGQGVFNLAWLELLPAALPGLPARRQLQLLADCFNLAENLEHEPVWLRRVFLRVLARGNDLGDLRALVGRVEKAASGPPATTLGARPRLAWIDLGAEDRSFLPGCLHFLAPAVLCVHDRDLEAERPASLGVWLPDDDPLVLGPMGCRENPGPSSDRIELAEEASERDGRAGDVLNCAANAWRAALTLETSQFVVALLPA